MRKTKVEIASALNKAGFTVTINRKEGKTDVGTDKKSLALRLIEVRIPGKLWSQEVGDWCNKKKHRANEKRVINLIKEAIGKEAHFDLCDHDMGHSSEGDAADDAHLHFYALTAD